MRSMRASRSGCQNPIRVAAGASVPGVDQQRFAGRRHDERGLTTLDVDEEDVETLGGNRSRQEHHQTNHHVDTRHDSLDRYTAPNVNSVPVADRMRRSYSGPRRAERTKETLSNQARAAGISRAELLAGWMTIRRWARMRLERRTQSESTSSRRGTP